jgi:hypothetical protein
LPYDPKVVDLQTWRLRADIAYAFEMAEDVPLDAALCVAREHPDDRRALMVAAVVLLGTIVGRAA